MTTHSVNTPPAAEQPTPYPFATVGELAARWPGMPPGVEERAGVLLDDASQFILDLVPASRHASTATRRRVVCAVVRRFMESETREHHGLTQFQISAGPYQQGGTILNPDGSFYLRADEKKALGAGRQKAYNIDVFGSSDRSQPSLSRWVLGL